jgi:hypothetical protein
MENLGEFFERIGCLCIGLYEVIRQKRGVIHAEER